ncbi:MAG TPA: tetratricopeptide repeat protein [Ktedonobacteraceae bacterium]|nr:tetratricopeptide repeat protein [Ktedonobacteraceae bacterium]
MAKKKRGQPSISQEAQEQAGLVFEHYHQLADTLRATTKRNEAEEALAEISSISEAAQFVLLKMLSRERSSDAADLALGINELSPLKDVRKEAKRALIQLAGTRIYPQWKLEIEQPLASVIPLDVPRRFWKGTVTDSRDVGEMQLLLAWEQGEDNNEVLVFGFLLEFWQDGVRDFFRQVMSKRSFEKTASRMESLAVNVKLRDCTLAEARRFIREALAVNKKAGTQPHFDYRKNLTLINQLVLEAPELGEEELDDVVDVDLDDDYEEEGPYYETRDLSPEVVVTTFVQAYYEGKFETSYELLAAGSPLREGLSQEAWVESRKAWFDEAGPDGFEPNLLWERPAPKSGLWLPNIVSAGRRNVDKVIEAGWSIELDETARGEALPELPRATAVYSETDRHWFWTSYTLVKEEDQWRIQFMTDEGTEALNLPTAELRQKIREYDESISEITRKHRPTDADALNYMGDILRYFLQAAGYIDALLARSYDDYGLYKDAVESMQRYGFLERSLVYLEQITQRFEIHRAGNLRVMATVQILRSRQFDDAGDEERAERFLELAEATLRETLALEDRFEPHISLAEVLIDREENLDEARDHLLQAKAMIADTAVGDEAHIEMHLGEIDMMEDRSEEGLRHYQRVAELQPANVDSWADLGSVYNQLGNIEEAEASYRRAIELDPEDGDLYFALSQIYSKIGQLEKAIEIMEEGLSANPNSALLNVYLASMYIEAGDDRQAGIFLDKAERLDPESELVQLFRQLLDVTKKTKPTPISFKSDKTRKKHR